MGGVLRLAAETAGGEEKTEGEPGGGLLAQAAQVLADHRSEPLTNWVWRLQQRPSYASWPELRLSDVLGEVPVLLEALFLRLRCGGHENPVQSQPAIAERARRQLAFRLLQGASLEAVLNEQALLRDELWALFNRRLPGGHRPTELLALARALDGVLQSILELCVLVALEQPAQGQGEPAA